MAVRSLYFISAAFFVLSSSFFGQAQANPNTITLTINTDTYIDSRDPTYNFGVSTTAKVVVNGIDGSLTRTLFELPSEIWSISEGQLISAKVWFYVWWDQTGNRTVRLHPLTGKLVEGTGDGTSSGDGATWGTSNGTDGWTNSGGDYDPNTFVDAVESANWFSWDIAAFWNNPSLRSFGAILRMNDESDPGYPNMPRAPFTSSDGPANERPYIEVVYLDWIRTDINRDRTVDLRDFAILALSWLQNEPSVSVDISPPGGDGIVDFLDLAELASHWLEEK